ncbi:MAG: DUF222 domain-containing protein [Acidimicrobiales bacterium]
MGPTPAEQEADRIATRLCELAGVVNVAVAEMVDLVAQCDEGGAWEGYRSIAQWVMLHTGTSSARASKWVRMAGQLAERPVLRAAFGAGELSEDQVATVARVPVHNEAEITELAREASVPQLRRIMSSYTWPAPEDPKAQAEADEEKRFVSFGFDDDGWWHINGHLPGHEGALMEQALRLCRDRLHRNRDEAVRGGAEAVLFPEVTWADAAVAMADACIAGKGKGRSLAERYLTFLHLEAGADGVSHGRVHQGPALPDSIRRHLVCDGRIRPLFTIGGTPVNVGRAQRVVPDRLRWVIEDRDRGCRTPGCGATRVEIHHLTHWEDGGGTDSVNLVSLCPGHHKMHHQGLIHITGDPNQPNGLTFTLHNGRRLAPKPPKPPPKRLGQTLHGLGLPTPHWNHPSGESYDPDCIWFTPPPDPQPPPTDT